MWTNVGQWEWINWAMCFESHIQRTAVARKCNRSNYTWKQCIDGTKNIKKYGHRGQNLIRLIFNQSIKHIKWLNNTHILYNQPIHLGLIIHTHTYKLDAIICWLYRRSAFVFFFFGFNLIFKLVWTTKMSNSCWNKWARWKSKSILCYFE